MKKSPFIIIILLVIAVVAAFFLMKEKGTTKESSTITQQTESPCVMSTSVKNVQEDGWGEVSLCQQHTDGTVSEHQFVFPVAYFPGSFVITSTDEYTKPAVFLEGVWKIQQENEATSRWLYRIHNELFITTTDTPDEFDDLLLIDTSMKGVQLLTYGDIDMSAFSYDSNKNIVQFTSFDGTIYQMSIAGAPGESAQLVPIFE